MLIKGSGAKIDPSKTLVVQLVQTDIATGTQTQSSWGQQPQLISAQTVLSVATALNGQNIGARAVALLAATPAQPATATTAAQPATPAQVPDHRRRRAVLTTHFAAALRDDLRLDAAAMALGVGLRHARVKRATLVAGMEP